MKFKITSKQLLESKSMIDRQCLRCGLTDDGSDEYKSYFHRAHIKGRGAHPELKNNMDNIVFLCGGCHIAQTVGKWGFCHECSKPAERSYFEFGKKKWYHPKCDDLKAIYRGGGY